MAPRARRSTRPGELRSQAEDSHVDEVAAGAVEEADVAEADTEVLIAWPAPDDPPMREVRLPGLHVQGWPQPDGSMLYELRFQKRPPSGRR